ncbi:hypothetical protein AMTR_s00023p00245260 [Amborella trichopoda]|uniref:Uncharacterized protein n=1 Tax=Amborella trichopoda TaxID=13333 RepID=W1NKN7_AMBTC|nr:hypothetical protein AMTR_s00023p00245260 [Amborella trichopoda]
MCCRGEKRESKRENARSSLGTATYLRKVEREMSRTGWKEEEKRRAHSLWCPCMSRIANRREEMREEGEGIGPQVAAALSHMYSSGGKREAKACRAKAAGSCSLGRACETERKIMKKKEGRKRGERGERVGLGCVIA